MDIIKSLDRINKVIEKTDFERLHIEVTTKTDTYILNKEKPKNKIGFSTLKGGE